MIALLPSGSKGYSNKPLCFAQSQLMVPGDNYVASTKENVPILFASWL